MHTVEFTKQARKALDAMPANVRRLVLDKIVALAADPSAPNNNVKKLVGEPGFRLRVGDWRLIYNIDGGRLVIHVMWVGPRGGAYE